MPGRSRHKSRRPTLPAQSQILAQLSSNQKQLLAEILGNVAVAWFAVGVISPLFFRSSGLVQVLPSVIGSVLISIFFVYLALRIIKEVK